MSTSRSINQYSDVQSVLDAAIAQDGARYVLPSPGKATHWRHRANAFCKLLRTISIERSPVPGFYPSTPYDTFELIIEKSEPNVVIIRRREIKGKLETLDGAALTPTAPNVPTGDPELDAIAAELLRKHS